MRSTTIGIVRLAGIGVMAIGIALGTVGSGAASVQTNRLTVGDLVGPPTAREAEPIDPADTQATAQSYVRVRIEFLPE